MQRVKRGNEKEFIIWAKPSTGWEENGGGRGDGETWSETDSHDSDRRKSERDAEPQDPLTFDPSSLTAPDPSSISPGSALLLSSHSETENLSKTGKTLRHWTKPRLCRFNIELSYFIMWAPYHLPSEMCQIKTFISLIWLQQISHRSVCTISSHSSASSVRTLRYVSTISFISCGHLLWNNTKKVNITSGSCFQHQNQSSEWLEV